MDLKEELILRDIEIQALRQACGAYKKRIETLEDLLRYIVDDGPFRTECNSDGPWFGDCPKDEPTRCGRCELMEEIRTALDTIEPWYEVRGVEGGYKHDSPVS